MREKYESLSAAVLKDLAKAREIKGSYKMKKEELVEAMLVEDEKDKERAAAKANKKQEQAPDNSNKESLREEKNTKPSFKEKKREHKQRKDISKEAKGTKDSVETKEKEDETAVPSENADEAKPANGILEVLSEGYGFIRCANYLPGENDVYVSPAQIRKFNLKTGDIITGTTRRNNPTDKFGALIYIDNVNGYKLEEIAKNRIRQEFC